MAQKLCKPHQQNFWNLFFRSWWETPLLIHVAILSPLVDDVVTLSTIQKFCLLIPTKFIFFLINKSELDRIYPTILNAIISYLRNFQFLILIIFFKFLILIFNTIILIPILNDIKILLLQYQYLFLQPAPLSHLFCQHRLVSRAIKQRTNLAKPCISIKILIKNILYILTEKHFWIKKMHTFKMLVEKKITCIKCPRPLLYSQHKKHVDTLHLRSESNHTSPMAACWAGSSISH